MKLRPCEKCLYRSLIINRHDTFWVVPAEFFANELNMRKRYCKWKRESESVEKNFRTCFQQLFKTDVAFWRLVLSYSLYLQQIYKNSKFANHSMKKCVCFCFLIWGYLDFWINITMESTLLSNALQINLWK